MDMLYKVKVIAPPYQYSILAGWVDVEKTVGRVYELHYSDAEDALYITTDSQKNAALAKLIWG